MVGEFFEFTALCSITLLAINGIDIPINRYFLNHPEMVLGMWSGKDTLYGGEGYSVTGNGDLAHQLSRYPGVQVTRH